MNHFGRVAAAGWVVVVEVVMRLECKCSQREREREMDGATFEWNANTAIRDGNG